MDIADLFDVLDALRSANVPCWVAGGWGVDVLVGRRTRAHRDVDLALDAATEAAAIEALAALDYRIETDQRPARAELAAPGRRWVDLHPVAFDALGVGRQADLQDGYFLYPQGAFTVGRIRGRTVPCLSVAQQLAFRRGYALRDVDHHDIALLRGLDGTSAAGPPRRDG
ncbi:nucleotidyltransferase domain-containing protein [Streptomyces sp. NPDC059786]|uniref:nucleotidyltransferase domain-containing protein n=1 Tax=Streptomyces sp. NPDC059786 TaxID=3346946 RepID=UPI00365F3B6F